MPYVPLRNETDGSPPLRSNKVPSIETRDIAVDDSFTREKVSDEEYLHLLHLETQGVELTAQARKKILDYRRT